MTVISFIFVPLDVTLKLQSYLRQMCNKTKELFIK